MIILGIDPGLSGGLVWLEDAKIVLKRVMPVIDVKKGRQQFDEGAIGALLRELKPDHAILEETIAMPGQSSTSSITTGKGWGIVWGALGTLEISRSTVSAQAWQKIMLAGLPKEDTKAMAQMICLRLWPKENWLATQLSKKPHKGLVDAALIAEYGRRTLDL